MFVAIRERLEKDEDGFTLIELLVVVIIIGILAAIAIPTFLRQRERGWDASAESDLRNMVIAMESCATAQGGLYTGCDDPAQLTANGFNQTANVVTTPTVVAGDASWTATSKHATGPTTFSYDSSVGQITRAP